MSFLAFPLRLHNGFLRRTTEVESILGLLRLMAGTPGGSWPGSANFGVRDLFERARMQPDAPKIAAERINRAFIDLGITGYRIDSIVKELSSNRDVDHYVVNMISTVDASKTYSIALSP